MEFDWESFKYNVSINNVVPILGNDLSTIRLAKNSLLQSKYYDTILKCGTVDKDYIRINLYKYLAIKLWEIYGRSEPISYSVNFNSIVLQLLSRDIKPDTIKNAIRNETIRLTDEQIVLDPYRKLLQVKGFENFVTVNIDNFLERAFEAEGKKVNTSINFSIQDAESNPDEKPDRALPKIFNLMGNIKWGKFVDSDEESLECLYMIKNDSSYKAKTLFDTLEGKSLLFIGCSFPDWFMRFFIRIIANERYTNSSRDKYVVGYPIFRDNDIRFFLENNKTLVIPFGGNIGGNNVLQIENSIEFITEINNQFYGKIGPALPPPRTPLPGKFIFLSYSRDDSSIAEKLKNEFDRNGINVFYDKDSLKTGGDFDEILIKTIKDAAYFIALISKNSTGDKNRYVYDTEWSFAIAFDTDKNYLRPYIIDDTSPTDEKIPKRIREKNITTITNFDDFGEVVRKFIKENNLAPVTQETKPTS